MKIKDLIKSRNNNSVDYDEKYLKIKFNSNDDFPLKKNASIAWNDDSCWMIGTSTISEFS